MRWNIIRFYVPKDEIFLIIFDVVFDAILDHFLESLLASLLESFLDHFCKKKYTFADYDFINLKFTDKNLLQLNLSRCI